MQLTVANIDLFLMVFMRMSGAILFNPLLGRNNVPFTLKAALSLSISFFVMPTITSSKVLADGIAPLVVSCASELAIGFGIGIILSGLFSVVLMAGELIDMQMGFAMANFYDPSSGVNTPIVGNLINILMILVFFSGNAHLALFKLLSDSYSAVPPGTVFLTPKSLQFIVVMGGDIFEMGLRLALPIVAVEIIVQLAMGILMRAAPQINIFTVGIQIQAIVGIALLLILIPVIVTLCGRLSSYIIEKCVEFVKLLT